ncbi:MAG: bifunctional homocysteine S-methyltransferase/methylenetetrahydrofolate reductase [Ignavibacteria bacterium RIFCSPHIGHO2_02_FULL_56_12]|nr:MAG: bifunctional homocysteine S-methyltransferase/methylenetetrahydrofolate reductase [Ignavibacteria bacterium RIFCSPHIGHO2_02_FULL_56_12]
MKQDFRQRLKKGPILCDGAMGTLLDLYEYAEQPREIHNATHPEIIERIHREYIEAGSEIIQTNTYGGNRYRLAEYHLADRVEELNRLGVEIARRAADDSVYVAGSVGPTGKLLQPIGKLKLQEARDAFRRQIEVLLKAGVDLIMLETFVSLHELDEALAAAKELTKLPVVAQKTFPEDGAILSGSFPVEVAEHLLSRGADVVGANCTVGPQRMFSIITSMHKEGIYLSAQPAAGIPTLLDGRALYHTSPEYLAQYARELLQAGVTIVGACCGSTPAHLREIKKVLDEFRSSPAGATRERTPQIQVRERSGPADAADVAPDSRSRFARNLGTKFLTSVELDVPRGLDMSSVLDGARYLHRHGIDAINITDGARARLRISSVALSHMLQRDVGIEAMMHMTTRDRNMIGVQAELLGAHALGIRNVLFITGDPTNIGDYPQATSVFDIDSSGLIRSARAMNEGRDLMGNAIGQSTSFLIACAVNAMADNMDAEMAKLEKKIEAGVHVIYTQPIYEMRTLESLLKRIDRWKVPIMLGVLPLRGFKHAEFLHNEIPGMVIPERIREQFRSAGPKAQAVGIEISVKFLTEAKSLVAGAYIMPPFKKYEIVPEILAASGVKPS